MFELAPALNNLASPAVLFFALGVFAAAVRSDLAIPDQISRMLALYLMTAIGFKGGVQISKEGFDATAALTLLAGLAIGLSLPFIAIGFLSRFTSIAAVDAASIAAHYGSVSVVTFSAATAFLVEAGVTSEGFMPAVLALMEAPAIIVGVFMARRALGGKVSAGPLLHESLTNGTVLMLVGSTVIGLILGTRGLEQMEPVLVAPFIGVVAIFLLDMGIVAARRISDVREAGWPLLAFAIYMPLVGAAIGLAVGTMLGLSVGGVTLLAVLSGSASYIAAPAAMGAAVPEANPSLSLPLVLAITFPFNLVVGIPLYYTAASALAA
ncbi:MAG: sodium-dependent bicarbonate transport family permease [Thermoleophilaceae bacterium]|nr:sodium-dependent bicarbonate transport family permease [Thermoleophilaceae bacterium]